MGDKMTAVKPKPRPQKLGEEIFNSITHGVGALLAIAGLVLLIVRAASRGSAINVVSVTLYGVCLVLLYVFSCLYHALKESKAKRVFQVLDHSSIFLLILGSYIPVALVNIGGAWGWVLFGVGTACTIVGIVLNAVDLHRWKRLSQVLYLAMGWMVVIVLPKLYHSVTHAGFALLACGGVLYTVGTIFYRQKEKLYWHGIWHLFVLAGSILQYFAIYFNCCG